MMTGRSTGRAINFIAVGVVAGLLSVAVAPPALAAKPRVGVSLTGASAGPVREAVATTLRHHGYELVATDVGVGDDASIAAAAKGSHLPALIVGEVRDGKRLKLQVYGAGGDVIGAASWTERGGAKRLAGVVGRTLWARLGGALAKASGATATGAATSGDANAADEEEKAAAEPPAKDAQTTKASKGADDNDSTAADAGEGGAPREHAKPAVAERDEDEDEPASAGTALDLSAGLRFMSRSLTWAPSGTALRDYSLGPRTALGLTGAWYPAAPYRADWLSNLGLGGSVEWAPGLASLTSGGASYPTTATDLEGDARYRLLLGDLGQLAFVVGGGQQSFIFHSQGTARRNDIENVPDVQYSYLRAGVDARFTLPASLSLLVSGGYRYVLGAGSKNYLIQESSFIPNSTVVAFDVAAGVGYRFLSVLEARAGFDLRRYQLTAGANDAMVTSATDQYTAFWLRLAILLDGASAPPEGHAARPAHEEQEQEPSADDHATTKPRGGGDSDTE
jgi:hypothetical protein